ncbi:MAG TPA: acyltransferase [Candidatus Binatia bacterium]|nr:acyltransferase [Candidatus Binatia bacterium]
MRFRALDAWRGICASMIALLHFCIQEWPVPCQWCAASLVTSSWLFVDFFFVLSGFVIGHAYGDRLVSAESLRIFALRRFGRLWPLHAATLAAVVAVRVLAPVLTTGAAAALPASGRQSLTSLGLDLVLVRPLGFGIDPAYHLDWNYPSWSIGVELWVCLLFALLCMLVRRRILLHALETFLIAACAALLYAALGVMDATDDYGFLRCLYGFLTGRLLYELFRRCGPPSAALATALETAVVAAVVVFVAWSDRSPWTIGAPLLFAAAIFVFAHESGAISRALVHPFPQRLGELSYSIYMVHVAVYEVMLRLGMPGLRWLGRQLSLGIAPAPWLGVLELVVATTAVLAASSVTYRWIEQPGRRYFNGLASPSTLRSAAR